MRYVRGEVLEALHRPAEALAWYDASGQDYSSGWYAAAILVTAVTPAATKSAKRWMYFA